ncbi:MAG TPA: TolC family protein [Planctomicrobium sp.]|nr:TolC family protein [Planctomicrobium sp.]
MSFQRPLPLVLLLVVMSSWTGCGSVRNYFHNGFKVGPDYTPPCASVAEDWIDNGDPRIHSSSDDLSGWWTVFDDPQLNGLIQASYEQNLTLREAGFRILSARAQLGYAKGNFFPQFQTAQGGYSRLNLADNFFDQWNFGFNLAWELDFWGRYRRAIAAAEATLDASVHDYDYVLVTLLGDVATSYVEIRTTQERIRLAENTLKIQADVLKFIEERLKAGAIGVTELDRAQAQSNWKQSQAQIHDLRMTLRIAENQLCILQGIPPADLTEWLASGPEQKIPEAPAFVAVGIPAELLGRRPDLRRAERLVAAQAEQIGIAEADWLPAISINGTLGWQANSLSNLFAPQSQTASIGPAFQWNILNYGRILNNVRFQEAEYQRLITVYQNTALQAAAEVENGIIRFTQASERAQALEESVDAAYTALGVVVAQYEAGLGGVDFNRYATILQSLVQQQDTWAQAQGQNAQGLIDIYRALGGGWQIRLAPVPDKQGILSEVPPLPGILPIPDLPEQE